MLSVKGQAYWLKRTNVLVSISTLRYYTGIGVAKIKTLKNKVKCSNSKTKTYIYLPLKWYPT